ncbi:CD244 protein, partial [Balaeniceps rex]|nr:CD244 protein [Balaeniceps rex]
LPSHGTSPRAVGPCSPLSALGCPECQEQAVSANGALQLLPEKPPQEWARVEWRVLGTGYQQRILTAEKNKTALPPKGRFSGRAVFHQEPLYLWISPVSTADSGVYRAEFEDTSGVFTILCFCVSVWEPIHLTHLEARILHREQGRCNLSLVCTVPGAVNVSYNWSCTGDPLGALERQPWLHLQVHEDADPTVCLCNVSNPVSWRVVSTDIAVACSLPFFSPSSPGTFNIVPWWAVAVLLGLALAISVALVTRYWWRKQGKDPPGGHLEQTLTIYEEVGKAQTGRDPNRTSEATVGGNTIYAVVCTKTQGPSHPQEPENCTIYSMVQPRRKVRLLCRDPGSRSAPQSPSLKRKRLDPALVSTAYVEAT